MRACAEAEVAGTRQNLVRARPEPRGEIVDTVKRRWPDLLIGLLVLLLLGGFAALLLGRGTGSQNAGNQAAPVQQAGQTPVTQTPSTQMPTTQTPQAGTPAAGTQTGSQAAIPTIPAASVPNAGTAQPGVNPPATVAPDQTQTPVTTPPAPTATDPAPLAGGAVAPSEVRTPTRNDYRISLGSYASSAAVRDATAGVGKLGYTVYPIDVASGTVAQVGPFASREAAVQALADIQRALPGALLYSPRNAPAGDTGVTSTQAPTIQAPTTQAPTTQAPTSQTDASPSPTVTPAASGPVYLQVGAYNSTAAAQTTVSRVRDLGLEPSVNAPAGKLVTVLVGPFQGQALAAAEAKLQASGISSFRVR